MPIETENARRQPEPTTSATSQISGNGVSWFKTMRGETPMELIKANPLAYILAAVIAHRARWRDGFNQYGLGVGESFLGDYEAYGMSEQQYRTTKDQLFKWGFATFRSTNKGTIGKLTDSSLFATCANDSNEQINTQATDSQRTANEQPTDSQRLTKKDKKGRIEDVGPKESAPAPKDISDAEWLEGLKANPAYSGMDVTREFGKMNAWCQVNRKQPSRKRFVYWMNRCERPLQQILAQPNYGQGF